MTTNVTITTHSWPVAVTTTETYGRTLHTAIETIPPHSNKTLWFTSSQSLKIDELPQPPIDPATSGT